MGGAQIIQALLGTLERDTTPRRVTTIPQRLLTGVVIVVIVAVFVGVGAYAAWWAWQTGEWFALSGASIVFFLPLVTLMCLAPIVSTARRINDTRPVRRAVL